MDDLISRHGVSAWLYNLGYPKLADIVMNEQRFPSAQSEQRWIPVSERLPEYGCPVLWCNENGSVFVSAITVKTDHGWAIGKRHRMCKVIAWMPLPEPYQTERWEE
jgi:hypothetical protein